MFISNELTSYLEQFIPERDPIILEIEAYAKEHQVPIMELVGIETLLQLLKLVQPKSILEIGTAIGYSAIRMARALPNTTIVTIERDEQRYQEAIKNIEKIGLTDRITVLFGDALELGEQVKAHGPFDSIFIDAAKGQYQRFFELYTPCLSSDGVVFSDNVLFKGLVANDGDNNRLQKIADKIKVYNEWLMNHPDYETTILTVGDGLAISRKR